MYFESKLSLELTGKQGCYERKYESFKTVAWNLISEEKQKKILDQFHGIHIHCPEGAPAIIVSRCCHNFNIIIIIDFQ